MAQIHLTPSCTEAITTSRKPRLSLPHTISPLSPPPCLPFPSVHLCNTASNTFSFLRWVRWSTIGQRKPKRHDQETCVKKEVGVGSGNGCSIFHWQEWDEKTTCCQLPAMGPLGLWARCLHFSQHMCTSWAENVSSKFWSKCMRMHMQAKSQVENLFIKVTLRVYH
jgi:hypothetical protein